MIDLDQMDARHAARRIAERARQAARRAPSVWVEVDPEDLVDDFIERAAISQHDGKESPEYAKELGLDSIRGRYRVLKKMPG